MKACPECGLCKRNELSYNGVPISVRNNRKLGRQPGALKRKTLNKRAATSGQKYCEESIQAILKNIL